MTGNVPPAANPALRRLRAAYVVSMVIGLPLWLVAVVVPLAGVFMKGLRDVGPIEFQEPSALQSQLLSGALITYSIVYPATLFTAHRITRWPWIPFAAHLLPVLLLLCIDLTLPSFELESDRYVTVSYLALLTLCLCAGLLAGLSTAHHRKSA